MVSGWFSLKFIMVLCSKSCIVYHPVYLLAWVWYVIPSVGYIVFDLVTFYRLIDDTQQNNFSLSLGFLGLLDASLYLLAYLRNERPKPFIFNTRFWAEVHICFDSDCNLFQIINCFAALVTVLAALSSYYVTSPQALSVTAQTLAFNMGMFALNAGLQVNVHPHFALKPFIRVS